MLKNTKQHSVLLLCAGVNPGGMERVVLDMHREFSARGWRSKAVFPKIGLSDGFEDWARAQGVECEISDSLLDAAAEHSRSDMMRLRFYIAANKPDIVHFHYGSSFVSLYDILAAKLAGVKKVYATLHQAVSWDELEPRKKKMTGLCGKWLTTKMVAICSDSVKILVDAGVPSSKIALIYCGVRVSLSKITKPEARKQLGVDENAFVVLTVASLTKRKGVDDVIRAVAQVPDSTDSVRLLIAGDGTERANLETQAAEEIPGKAVFLGRITGDMSHIYAAADVFVLASHAEGVPLVCHEASMSAVPSIATDVGGTAEAIIPAQTGFLVENNAPDQIALAIRQLRDSPETRTAFGLAAQRRAAKEFTDIAMADSYEEEFLR